MLLASKVENIAKSKDDPEDHSQRAHDAHTEWHKHSAYSSDFKGTIYLNKTARTW